MRRRGNAWVVDVAMEGSGKEAEIWVDSAAEESVCPVGFAEEFDMVESGRVVKLVNASGKPIEHYGQKSIKAEAMGF